MVVRELCYLVYNVKGGLFKFWSQTDYQMANLYQLQLMQKFEDSFDGAYYSSGKKNPQPSAKKSKIIINVAETQYPVVKHVAKKFKWNLITEPITNLNFDICWIDGHVRQEFFARMQPHQKVNHFPGMAILSRKNCLGKSLMAFRRKFPTQYEFFPITWSLPTDYSDLQAYHQCRQQGKAQTFIVKPEASCQGRGIYLTRNIDSKYSINLSIEIKNDKCVVQRYMHKPLLIDGLKFDLRIYVLVAGIDPLRIFVYEEGLARFATEPYKPPRTQNLDNRFMHLTNYAVNKESPNFIFNDSAEHMDIGHKRSLTSIYKKLAEEGHDVVQLKRKINQIFIKTIITGYPTLSSSYMASHADNFANDMCFQVLGFDIMIDHKLNPYLLEINYTPSFTTDTPLDRLIKKNLIQDTLTILDISDRWKKDMKAKRDKQIQERMVSGKRRKYTNQQRKSYMIEQARKRDQYQMENIGGFTKIFMLSQEQMNQYKKYYDYAFELQGMQTSLSSINNFSSINQFPYYKHYFQDNTMKNQSSSGTFYKNKKVPLKEKNSTSKITTITTEKLVRQQVIGGSQGRRISSAKPLKVGRRDVRHEGDKLSVKGSQTRNQEQISKDVAFEPTIDNASIFRNKKLEAVGVRKRRNSLDLADPECLDA